MPTLIRVASKKKHNIATKQISTSHGLLILAPFVLIIIWAISRVYAYRPRNVSKPVLEAQMKTDYLCPMFDTEWKDKFLVHYKIRTGDSLIGISKKQLGSVSRVGEIVALNRERYPTLTTSRPILETGMDLVLPPQDIQFDSSDIPNLNNLSRSYGAIAAKESADGYWRMADGKGGLPVFHVDSKTRFIGRTSFEVGDCVVIMGIGTKTYTIEAQ